MPPSRPTWFSDQREPPLGQPRRTLAPTDPAFIRASTLKFYESSIEKSTRTSHNNAWTLWRHFNDNSEPTPMPDTPEKVAGFAAWLARSSYKWTTVMQYVAGIGKVYEAQGYTLWPSIRSDPALIRVLTGIKKDWNLSHSPNVPNRNQDLLQWPKFLTALNSWDNTDSHNNNLLFRAILIFGFTGLHRLAELVAPDDATEARRTCTRRIQLNSIYYNLPTTYIEYFLAYHKGDPSSKGSLCRLTADRIWCNSNHLQHVMKYLTSRAQLPASISDLFLTHELQPPNRTWFLRRFAIRSGCAHGSKSLRAGGATHAAAHGKSAADIRFMGRWSSNAWRAYILSWHALRNALQ